MSNFSKNALQAIILHISKGNFRFPVRDILPYDDSIKAIEIVDTANFLVKEGVLEQENEDRALLSAWYVLMEDGAYKMEQILKKHLI